MWHLLGYSFWIGNALLLLVGSLSEKTCFHAVARFCFLENLLLVN